MAENMNPATMGGARVVAKASKLASQSITEPGATVTSGSGEIGNAPRARVSVGAEPERSARKGSHRERDDDYVRVVARLDSRTRVIVCADRMQWIIQRRDAGTAHRAHWRGVSFHLSRDALIAASVRLAGARAPAALAILHQLPERFGARGRHV